MAGLCTSMAHPELDWRRHLELLLDGLRARGCAAPPEPRQDPTGAPGP